MTPVAMSMLSVLANKYPIENSPGLISALEQKAAAALKDVDVMADKQQAVERLTFVYALSCGLLRRFGSKKAEGLLKLIRDGPAHPVVGKELAQRLEMLVAPQTFLTKDNYAVVKPLWMQRVYFELVGPMLQAATGSNADVTDPLIKTNYSLGVILMLRHMSYSIYEADAEKVLRIAISTAQSLGTGPEVLAALDALQNILLEAPEKGQDHLRSIVNICVRSFTGQTAPTQRPEWLPAGYAPSTVDQEVQAGCGKLALEIAGVLPRMYEARRLVSFLPQVERELTMACGHGVRDLRRLARLARQAWAGLK